MLFKGDGRPGGEVPPWAWLIVVYLALFSTIGTYLLQNAALRKASARTVSLVKSFCPVMTTVFSFLILGETLSLPGAIGVVLILASILFHTLWEGGRHGAG